MQMLDENKTMTYLETWKSMVEHIIPEMTANLETWRPLNVLKLTEMTQSETRSAVDATGTLLYQLAQH